MTNSRVPAQQTDGKPHPRFPHLFSPLEIGPITAKNRIVNSAHTTGFARDGLYSEQLVAYHAERARGGAAIIVSQATSVSADYGDLHNVDDAIIPWYQRVVEAVHPFGARYFAELSYGGRQGAYHGTGAEIFYAPSAVPNQPYGWGWRVAHEMEPETIAQIVGDFGAAARRCRQGGLDGIELHFAHGNLAQQFMSPLTNRRTDEWGGCLENRLRFAREVLSAVREAVGRDLAVGCRLTGSELVEGGLTDSDMAEIAAHLDDLRMLDYISVTMGHYSDLLESAHNIPDMSFRPGLWRKLGANIKHAVRVPVCLVGRINHPTIAEDLLAKADCDMVAMARALIADPELPVKSFAGDLQDIRVCVGVQEGCWGHFEAGRGITCVQNPVAGREREWAGSLLPAERARRVVVVGGGPAGLEQARVAALRGHQVILLEREGVLGGQVGIAARAPHREELGQMVEWFQRQCAKAGVDTRLGTEATERLILDLSPDVVIVATGAEPARPDAMRAKGVDLLDAWAVLNGGAQIGKRVLVVDETGKRPGFQRGGVPRRSRTRCSLRHPDGLSGQAIEWTGWRVTYQRLLELAVSFHPLSSFVRADGGRVVLRHVYTGAPQELENIDAVVLARPPQAHDGLYRSLKGKVEEMHLIGDALAPRGIEEAIYEAQKVGRAL